MTDFTPTPEQLACIDAAKTSTDNLLISALAGAAKTSTLVLIAKAMPGTAMLCAAFNKRIQLEMEDRLPGNCTAKTLNGLGHSVWASTIGRRVIIDKDKCYRILSSIVDGLPQYEKDEAFETFSETLRAIRESKTCGYIPTGTFPHAKRLMEDEDFFAWMAEEPTPLQERIIREACHQSLTEAMRGTCDFDDQILMPTCFPCTFPQYPCVLIDEAQDLSSLNHMMLRKFAKKRLIAVGDECQSIYGFRGAHEDSMELLRETFDMRTLTLSVSFRCPKSIVAEAQWRAPHMTWPEWAKEGEVRTMTDWSKDDLPDEAAIICRNNAPLFSMAIRLLKNKRYVELVGNDIGKTLVKVMKKLGDGKMDQSSVLVAIDAWLEGKMKKSRDHGKVQDQAACMRVFAREGNTLGEAIAYANHLMSVSGPIKLMTGHKSKGLEFTHVFILDRELVRTDRRQEQNLLYVMQTRSKDTLTYITSEMFNDATE